MSEGLIRASVHVHAFRTLHTLCDVCVSVVSRSQTLSAKARESLVNCPYKTCSSHPPEKRGGVKWVLATMFS